DLAAGTIVWISRRLLQVEWRLCVFVRGAGSSLPDAGRRLLRCGHATLLTVLLVTLMRGVHLAVALLTLLVEILFARVDGVALGKAGGGTLAGAFVAAVLVGDGWEFAVHDDLLCK